MKNMSLILLFATAAYAVVVLGCGSREGEGSCVWCPDTSDIDDTIYGDANIGDSVIGSDTSPPDGSTDPVDEDVLTAQEYCVQYLGTWECVCDQGSCCKGCSAWYLLELLQVNDKTWTILVTREGGSQWTITCDPQHPPPNDYDSGGGWSVTIIDNNSMNEDFHNPNIPTDWSTSLCTRL